MGDIPLAVSGVSAFLVNLPPPPPLALIDTRMSVAFLQDGIPFLTLQLCFQYQISGIYPG